MISCRSASSTIQHNRLLNPGSSCAPQTFSLPRVTSCHTKKPQRVPRPPTFHPIHPIRCTNPRFSPTAPPLPSTYIFVTPKALLPMYHIAHNTQRTRICSCSCRPYHCSACHRDPCCSVGVLDIRAKRRGKLQKLARVDQDRTDEALREVCRIVSFKLVVIASCMHLPSPPSLEFSMVVVSIIANLTTEQRYLACLYSMGLSVLVERYNSSFHMCLNLSGDLGLHRRET